MSLSRFRLITFDVTDTLLKFRTSPGKQYGEMGAMFGVLSNKDELVLKYKSSWQKMNRSHPNFGLKTKIDVRQWWKLLITGIFTDNGVNPDNVSDEKMNEITNHLLETFKTSACWQHSYGSVEFLNYLKLQRQIHQSQTKKLPFKLGVISNFDPRLDVLLRNMKINHYFDFIINSYDAGCEKPEREIFLKAMRAAEVQDLQPEQCLHIGDTPTTDYLGAKNCGWYSLLVHDKNVEYLRQKYGDKIEEHQVFNSLLHIHKMIANNYMKW